MTAKRFTMGYKVYKDNLTGERYDEVTESYKICELLNVLHEETQSSKEFIEQLQEELVLFKEAGANMGIDLNTQITALKQENEQLQHDATILIQSNQDYRKENEQLKFQLDECRNHKLFSRRELEEENEQLKKQIEELKVDLKMAKIDGAINRMAQRPIRW